MPDTDHDAMKRAHGNWCSTTRHRQGLTQRDLASAGGASPTSVNQWEAGNMGLQPFLRLAAVFGQRPILVMVRSTPEVIESFIDVRNSAVEHGHTAVGTDVFGSGPASGISTVSPLTFVAERDGPPTPSSAPSTVVSADRVVMPPARSAPVPGESHPLVQQLARVVDRLPQAAVRMLAALVTHLESEY